MEEKNGERKDLNLDFLWLNGNRNIFGEERLSGDLELEVSPLHYEVFKP